MKLKEKLYKECAELIALYEQTLAVNKDNKNTWLQGFFDTTQKMFTQIPANTLSYREKRKQKSSYYKEMLDFHYHVYNGYLAIHLSEKNMPVWMKKGKQQSFIPFFEIFLNNIHTLDPKVLAFLSFLLQKGTRFIMESFASYKKLEQEDVLNKKDYQTLCAIHAALQANKYFLVDTTQQQ